MKTVRTIDDLTITNDVHVDADGEPLFEEVTCETGSFPALKLVAEDGELVE